MGIIDNVKAVADVVRQIDNIDLYRQIVDLQAEVMGVVEENNRLKKEIASLEERLTIKEALFFERDCYWLPQGEGKSNGPFCSNCWDTRHQLVRMIRCNEAYSECPTCKRPILIDESWRPPIINMRRPSYGN